MKNVIRVIRSFIVIAAACVPADGFAGGAPITPPGTGTVTVQKIGPGEARRGQTITYTITIPAVTAAVWGVDLTDPKVQGLTYLSVTSALNSCQIVGGGVRCHWNDIHPGSPRTATVTARVDDSAPCNLPIVNRATVTVTKPPANVFAEASTLIKCDNVPPTPPVCSDGIDNDGDGWIDLEDSGCGGNPYGTTEHNSPPNGGGLIITKVQTRNGMELPGGKVMYLITLKNNTGAGLWDVTVTDTTPQGLLLWNAPPGCSKGTAGFVCKIADLPAGQSITFNPVYKVPDGVPCGTQYPNTVTATSTKPTYRSASATGTAFICDTSAPACSDGQDNDGDGNKDFPADPGCSSPQDPDETDPKPQCSDGIDNDGDLKIDAADPGCSNPYDNNESDDPKPACSDGIDNDGDYLIDLADPGCVNANDPDEFNPRTECSDGIDNDGDGWIDFPEDGGCYSAQDPSEKDPNGPQCDNGRDDDYDAKIDFPADPNCSGPKDTTEHAPQCSDGADNDSDGTIDFPADYSCASGDDNDETTPKAQCQDGSDNDSDGWIDFPEDTGCSSKQDNSENTENLMPTCSNGKDDDGDGKIDFPADPGCTDAADNDEYNSTSQCSDGYDNDSDGWVDLEDSGCENAADNSELNTAAAIEPVVECVANNGDGSYSAFFRICERQLSRTFYSCGGKWRGGEKMRSVRLIPIVGRAPPSSLDGYSVRSLWFSTARP